MSQQSDVLKAYVTRYDPEPIKEKPNEKSPEKFESDSEIPEEIIERS